MNKTNTMSAKFKKLILACLLLSCFTVEAALPNCPQVPGSNFRMSYNLFGSLAMGSPRLKAQNECFDGLIKKDKFYGLIAQTNRFVVYEDHFSFPSNDKVIFKIKLPSQGDYLTEDTCSSPGISSNEIISQVKKLRVFENDEGVVIVHRGESCLLVQCPAFGTCD